MTSGHLKNTPRVLVADLASWEVVRTTPTRKWIAGLLTATVVAGSCSPGDGPDSIPLPTNPNATTTTSSTSTTSTTTTTTTTIVPPTFEATIRRTTDGVPHISGRNLGDLAYGQGYVSGEDYGCTLLDQIIKVRGERSITIGPGDSGQNVESDFAWRAIDIVGIAAADFEAAPPAVVDQFGAFASGWNQYLLDQADDGLRGWCAGATWIRPIQPVEVYTYARSVALLASGANFTDYIPSAQPPSATAETAAGFGSRLTGAPATDPSTDSASVDFSPLRRNDIGSNAWAIGAERTETGAGGILLANPHFPWEGELRFAEVHLTVPGEIDIYGAQLSGLPGVGIGFTAGVAWSHTVSAGNRFTAYTLDLDPTSPTTYFVDGEPQQMTATEHTVEIARPDGSIDAETRTLYRSEYGPVIDFPGIGWTSEQVLTYRDANIDNDEFVEFYLDMVDVADLSDLQETHNRHQAVPLFNTVAVGADGRTWYADTSATPNLSAEAEQLFLANRFNGDALTVAAYDQGVVLLDGSDSRFRWEESVGARDPGLVPYAEMPQVERTDYVFNANDSFWVPSDEFTISGDYSILHGEQGVPQSMRTRQNAMVLSPANSLGLAGADGNFSADDVRAAAFDNTAQTAVLLRERLVAACRFVPLVEVSDLLFDDGTVGLPAETVDLSAACEILAAWDGRFDLDSAGAVLWRETMARFSDDDFGAVGPLFNVAFSPDAPTSTPAGFTDDVTPLLQSLARAVQTITKAGFGVDASMGTSQFTDRTGVRIPIHGGTNTDGTTNIVSWSNGDTSSEEAPTRGEQASPGSALRGNGYPVNYGTSFALIVDYSNGTPAASALLTYGQTGLRGADIFSSQTTRFSEKNWRTVLFTNEAIAADPALTEIVVRQS
jgi:acyl-homoserine-lactone acylase